MPTFSYDQFLTDLAARESGGNYQIQNQYGYLGKYQMGEAALIDAGYYVKDSTQKNDWSGRWTGKDGVVSAAQFLNTPVAQENAIRAYMDKQSAYIGYFGLDSYVGETVNGTVVTESGLLAGAHLMGVGGLRTYLSSGGAQNVTDGNGTPISSYISKFAGYSISGVTPDTTAITPGLAPANIPGQSIGPGTPFKKITYGTERIRIYDNGVMYSVDSVTGLQFWSVPNATTGITEQITQFANGQIITEQVGANNVSVGQPAFYNNAGQLINPPATPTTFNYNDLSSIDKTLNQLFNTGSVGSGLYNGFTDYFSNWLVNTAPTQQIIPFVPGYNPADPYGFGLNLAPIGAFYETVTPALDLAPSIADKTPVLLDANNSGLSVSALTSRDTNLDGQLTGAELTGLNTWIDANENGQLDANELKTLTQANITQIKSADYNFYTQGNAVMGTGVAAEPLRPNETSGVPAAIAAQAMPVQPLRINFTQAVPASNYATLRATDNRYYIIPGYYAGYYIDWAPTQIKINYYSKNTLIGTDGADNFDASYYAAYTQYFNSGLLTNFMAGGGDDVFGGSIRADSMWGGLGNDCEAANDSRWFCERNAA